jgi:hypothetical protein
MFLPVAAYSRHGSYQKRYVNQLSTKNETCINLPTIETGLISIMGKYNDTIHQLLQQKDLPAQ